jgi:hypothetical protein
LKEQISNLSTILPHIVVNRLPPQRLVIETLTSKLLPELRNRSLEELFQFCTDTNDSHKADAPVGPPSDQVYGQSFYTQGPVGSVPNPLPHQFCTNTGDSHQADAPVGPLSGQPYINRQSLYTQVPVGSIPNHLPGYTSKSLQWHSPTAGINDGSPSNFTTNWDKYIHPSTSQSISPYLQEIDSSAQRQFSHCGREFPYFRDGNLLTQEQSGPYKAESSDLDSLINYSPSDACGNGSASPNPFLHQNFSAHSVDVPRASMPPQPPNAATHFPALAAESNIGSQSLVNIWQSRKTGTAYDQDAWTVNPKDLLRTPVADDCAQNLPEW